jgi:hypothetical protein
MPFAIEPKRNSFYRPEDFEDFGDVASKIAFSH